MLDYEINSCQGLHQSNLLLDQQIGSFPLEGLVWLDLDDDDDIAWFNIWKLVAFAMNGELLSIG